LLELETFQPYTILTGAHRSKRRAVCLFLEVVKTFLPDTFFGTSKCFDKHLHTCQDLSYGSFLYQTKSGEPYSANGVIVAPKEIRIPADQWNTTKPL